MAENVFTRVIKALRNDDSINKEFERSIAQEQYIRDTANKFGQVINGQSGAMWGDNSYDGNIKTYATNSTLYSIVKKITEKAEIAPFSVYRVKDKKKHLKYKNWTGKDATSASLERSLILKDLAYEEDTKHPMNRLLEKPNEYQTWGEFLVNSIGYKLLTGNCFIWVNRLDLGADKGQVYSMVNLPPQYMRVVSDGSLYGVREYVFTMGNEITIPKEEIYHSKYFNPDVTISGSHLLGLSPLKALGRTITRGNAAVERSTAYLQNAGSAGALVNKQGDELTQEQASFMKDDINQKIRGKNNVGKLSLLNGEWSYLSFGMTASDMQVLDTEKHTDKQLYNAYSYPEGLDDPSKSGEHNATEFKKQLITGAVMPQLSDRRDFLNMIAQTFNDNDIYIDYDVSVYPELQEDLAKTTDIMAKAWWIKGNEKRIATGKDEDLDTPMMDKYLVPSGMVDLDSLGEMGLQNLPGL